MLIVKPSRVSVALPFSSIWFGSHLREKTLRAASLLRYCAIFRVKKIFVILDCGDVAKHEELRDVLEYLLLPPYLKAEVGLKPHLRYVGLAPPIKTPLHTVSKHPREALTEPVREAMVIRVEREGVLLKAGFTFRTIAPNRGRFKTGDHVHVRVTGLRNDTVFVEPVNSEYLDKIYLEPKIEFVGVGDVGKRLPAGFFKVELTRRGEPPLNLVNNPPDRDVIFFVGNQRMDPEDFLDVRFDSMIRLLPEQGVETVRSEEALLIALSQMAWVLG
ncbi:MAG: putative RNA uridine N3 methyltransferase [Thermoprotei archaeon]